MFVRQPAIDSLHVSSGDILLLLISLNRPMVALEDYATDEADATICTLRRESDMVSTVVHLLLQQGRTALFYTFESDPYPEDLRGPVEEEAIDFVESLGFIMDDTRFGGIGPDDQKALLERPIFTGLLAESPPPGAAGTAFEVPPDPAFQFDPITPERLDAIDIAPQAEAPAPSPAADPLHVALPEASLQEMEIVLDEVCQDFRPEGPQEEKPGPVAAGSLSRFRRKATQADLYTIHGVGREERVQRPAETMRLAVVPDPDPAPPHPKDPPAEDSPADPDIRRRRARARFLASF